MPDGLSENETQYGMQRLIVEVRADSVVEHNVNDAYGVSAGIASVAVRGCPSP